MTAQEVQAAAQEGAIVLDMRPPKPFAKEHVAGAVNIQFNRADLADRAEMSLPADQRYVVHAEPEPIAKAAVDILRTAGFTVLGYLEGGLKGWTAAGLPTAELPLIDVDQLKARFETYRVLDAREKFEYKYAHIPDAELLATEPPEPPPPPLPPLAVVVAVVVPPEPCVPPLALLVPPWPPLPEVPPVFVPAPPLQTCSTPSCTCTSKAMMWLHRYANTPCRTSTSQNARACSGTIRQSGYRL